MIASRGLVLFANFLEVLDRGLNAHLNFVAAFVQIVAFLEQRAVLGCKRRHLCLPSEKGAGLLVDGAAMNDAFGGNEITGWGREGQAGEFLSEFQRFRKIG